MWNVRDEECASSLWPRHGYLPDVVFASRQVAGPVARLPEAVAVHLPAALAERRVAIRRPLQVKVTQLLQVCANNLEERMSCVLKTENIFSKFYLFIKPVSNYPIKTLINLKFLWTTDILLISQVITEGSRNLKTHDRERERQ